MYLLPLLLLTSLQASDWPRFRGPNGLGVAPDDRAPEEFSLDRNVSWKMKLPGGHSSPIVVKDRIYLSGFEGDKRLTLCLDLNSGKELWRKELQKVRTETVHPLNGPTTPTPATDGANLYVFFPEFGVVSYDPAGKERWRAPMGPFDAVQGVAVSPVFADGIVGVLIDQPTESYMIGFDAKTGKQRWKAERASGLLGGYSTPSVYKPAKGPTQFIVAAGPELTGYQATTGEKLWWIRGVTWAPAALPLLQGDFLYAMEPRAETADPFTRVSQYDKDKDGKVVVASEVTGDGFADSVWRKILTSIDKHSGNKDGAVDAEEWGKAMKNDGNTGGLQKVKIGGKGQLPESSVAWRVDKGMPYVTAPVLYRDVLYIVRNGGILSSYKPDTGELLKQERLKEALGDYYASPVAAAGKLFLVSKEGKMSVVKAGQPWEYLYGLDLNEQVIATPALANGRLIVRTATMLYCFGG